MSSVGSSWMEENIEFPKRVLMTGWINSHRKSASRNMDRHPKSLWKTGFGSTASQRRVGRKSYDSSRRCGCRATYKSSVKSGNDSIAYFTGEDDEISK